MTTLLIEMPSGVAGDMLLAALADLGGDLARVERDLLALGIGPIRIARKPVQVSGITALQVDVAAEQEARWSQPAAATPQPDHGHPHDHHHSHSHGHHHHHDDLPHIALGGAHPPHRPYRAIRDLLAAATLSPRVSERAQRVFRVLAEAEGAVHGLPPDDVEFHEVGALDAIADVVGCCLLLEQLGITRVIAGPMLPGSGYVRCIHGRMPVPVPAVAAMLATSGAPQRQLGQETGELTTPTGAALVIALTDLWLRPGTGMAMTTRRVGYGAGHKTIPGMANVLRASLVDDEAASDDTVTELRCQVDDSTGEQLAVLLDDLLIAGAKDAYLTPVLMKKGRPGHALTVLCAPVDRERIAALVLTRSTTIGVRYQTLERSILPRRSDSVNVQGQIVTMKVVTLPDGSERAKPEADDVTAAARILGRSFTEIQRTALTTWEQTRTPPL